MPYDWVPPAVFFRYRGFIVYHVYKNDQVQDFARDTKYSLKSTGNESDPHGEEGVFDTDELADYPKSYRPDEKDPWIRLIKYNIDQGYFDDWDRDEEGDDDHEVTVSLSLLRSTIDYLSACITGANLNEPDPDKRESGVNEYLELKELVDAADKRLRREYHDADQAQPAGENPPAQPASDGDGPGPHPS
jgi:hypothetical protein